MDAATAPTELKSLDVIQDVALSSSLSFDSKVDNCPEVDQVSSIQVLYQVVTNTICHVIAETY